jgi:proline iminopeptidase
MNALYPPVDADRARHLDLGDGHRVYVEECGRPDGCPVVLLHGGPGSGCRPDHRRYFDPDHYRIVLIDQRGSGRSTPLGATAHNDTGTLAADLEIIRAGLGIERWLLFGGSWGATLALVYAQTYPARVLGLVLRGTFLARRRDLDWFFGPDGAARLLPQAWRRFRDQVPAGERADLPAAYHRLVHGADLGRAAQAARSWSDWADRVLNWNRPPSTSAAATPAATDRTLAKVRIETHYARHRYFLEDNAILTQAHRLPRVPVRIVHGRLDLVCPVEGAWALHQSLAGVVPDTRLILVEDAGHLIDEAAMIDALIDTTDRLRSLLPRHPCARPT